MNFVLERIHAVFSFLFLCMPEDESDSSLEDSKSITAHVKLTLNYFSFESQCL